MFTHSWGVKVPRLALSQCHVMSSSVTVPRTTSSLDDCSFAVAAVLRALGTICCHHFEFILFTLSNAN